MPAASAPTITSLIRFPPLAVFSSKPERRRKASVPKHFGMPEIDEKEASRFRLPPVYNESRRRVMMFARICTTTSASLFRPPADKTAYGFIVQ
jgi:hypothetical protein